MRSIIRFCQIKKIKHESIVQKQELSRQQSLYDPVTGIKLEQENESLMDFKYSPNDYIDDGDRKLDLKNGNTHNSLSQSNTLTEQQYAQQEHQQLPNQFLMDVENNLQKNQPQTHGHSTGNSSSGNEFQQSGIKSEPMDYELTDDAHNDSSNNKLFNSNSVSVLLYKYL